MSVDRLSLGILVGTETGVNASHTGRDVRLLYWKLMVEHGTWGGPNTSRKATGAPLTFAIPRYGAMLAALTFAAWAQAPPVYPNYQPQPNYPAQPSYQQPLPPQTSRLSQQELSNLVAPVALYPDLLLSEVLAASTYPLELVQAQQWMQGNPALRGRELVDAAKQQNWDPSVQALVAFPDVLNTLTRDIQWTTDLGNAFLSQQADVMDAIQQLRASARDNGRLTNTAQQNVALEQQNGQNAILIQPTDPQVIYPPVYNPEYVWGPPVYGAYPALGYPPPDYGIIYAVGTFLGALFTGLLSFGGWGWGLSWLTHGLFLNSLFLSHFGFHGFGGSGYYGGGGYAGSGYAARVAWVHNPAHRLGVPYGNRYVAARYGGLTSGASSSRNYGATYSGRSFDTGRSGYFGSSYQDSSRQTEAYRGLTAGESRGYGYGGYSSGYRGGSSSYFSQPSYSGSNYGNSRNYGNIASRGGFGDGYASTGSPARGWSAPSSHYSEPRSSGERLSAHYSAPNSSGHFGGGGHFGGHSHSSGGGHSHGGSHKK